MDRETLDVAGEVDFGQPQAPETKRTSLAATVALVAAVVIAGALASAWLRGDTARDGTQMPSPPLQIGAAPTDGWEVLRVQEDDQVRAGFPQPLIRTATDICFGFSRVDFDVTEPVPSLARCIEPPLLTTESFVLVATVDSGFEVWHVFEFGDDVTDVDVEFVDGSDLDRDRIHIAGSAAALRLPADAVPSELRWSTRTVTYRCDRSADADRGQWCDVTADR